VIPGERITSGKRGERPIKGEKEGFRGGGVNRRVRGGTGKKKKLKEGKAVSETGRQKRGTP